MSDIKISEENLKLYLDLKELFENKIHGVLTLKTKLETGKEYKGSIVSIDIDMSNVEIVTHESPNCSCCSGENHYYEFPKSYLFDENWQDDVKKKIEDKKEQERIKKEEAEKKRIEDQTKRELAELKRLQNKYSQNS